MGDIGGKRPYDVHKNMEQARKYWIKQAQEDLPALCDKQVEKLVAFTDDEGVIRINGRLDKSDLFHEGRKHPILLPKNHPTSKLIVRQYHKDLCLPGYMRV